MSKEKFDASKLTRADLMVIDDALVHEFGRVEGTHKEILEESQKILKVKRKIEWLLAYGLKEKNG